MSLATENNLENCSEDILNAAREASSSLLPLKSKEKYEKVYEIFCKWRMTKNALRTDESVMLAYFFEKVSYFYTYFSVFHTMSFVILGKIS